MRRAAKDVTMTTVAHSFLRGALAATALLLLVGAPASATRLIPFQGRVTNGAGQPLADGNYRVTFAIYDEATGGEALYTESHTDVSIIGGQINVLLGSLVSLDDPNGDQDPADAVHFDDSLRPRYLGIKVGAETNQEMVPRQELIPSFHARVADTTIDGGVGTEQLADGAVTTPKIDPEVLIPAGAIMPYAGKTAPPGWVLCDGTQYDGTLPEFARLFDAVGLTFGGSGNMFQVPDLRGQFLRGLDPSGTIDPNGANRTLGSTQGFATIGLQGGGSTDVAGNHYHPQRYTYGPYADLNSGNAGQQGVSRTGSNDNVYLNRAITSGENQGPYTFEDGPNVGGGYPAGAHAHGVTVSVAPPPGATSTEVRPKNVAVNYICKL